MGDLTARRARLPPDQRVYRRPLEPAGLSRKLHEIMNNSHLQRHGCDPASVWLARASSCWPNADGLQRQHHTGLHWIPHRPKLTSRLRAWGRHSSSIPIRRRLCHGRCKLGKDLWRAPRVSGLVLARGAAMGIMALSSSAEMMNLSQALAGLAAAALVPRLSLSSPSTTRGRQKAQGLSILAGSPALAGIGLLRGRLPGHRAELALLFRAAPVLVHHHFIIWASALKPVPRQSGVKIEFHRRVTGGHRRHSNQLWHNNLNLRGAS